MPVSPDSIVALASAPGRAGVAVVRVSGPHARLALECVAGGAPEPRRAVLRTFRSRDGEAIDQGLVLYFEGPASFTGEDVAEFHVHGGRAVQSAMLEALCAVPGLRLAERGEFTRRAVENGRLDLTSAEGIADLVAADTPAQRRQALRQAGGALEQASEGWRGRLVRGLALVEAEIDFPDEEDVPALLASVLGDISSVKGEIEAALAGAKRGERLREGARFVIAGPPNAGKSTLLNALARRDAAIVSEIPGTTRDTIEVHLDLDGYPATLVDTAGLRETIDPVERMGVARTRGAIEGSDLVLWLSSIDTPQPRPLDLDGRILEVWTKADLIDSDRQRPKGIVISGLTGFGLDVLQSRLANEAKAALDGAEHALVTRERHRVELEAILGHLSRVMAAGPMAPVELLAEDIRLAVRGIGRLTGRVDIDEVYDVIFREFCIGK